MTEQDFLVSDSYFVIDTPVSLTSSQVVIGDNSVLCFRGGKLVNDANGVITLKGDNITIEAGPVCIFQANNNGDGFDFKAKTTNQPAAWTMERAYPQWFGAKDCTATAYAAYQKLKKIASKKVGETYQYYVKDNYVQLAFEGLEALNAIPDASAAINAAIRLKQRGEVFIPRGWYKLSGYPWLSTTPMAESYLNSLAQRPIESVKFIGENVECYCSSAVNLTHGTWRDGDVQYYPDGNDIRKRMYRDGAWHNMK